jgi:hypothetical protein
MDGSSDGEDSFKALSQVCAVLGTQWGDEGKGKLVDILAQRYDIVALCQVSLEASIFCFFFLLLLLSVAVDLVQTFAVLCIGAEKWRWKIHVRTSWNVYLGAWS